MTEWVLNSAYATAIRESQYYYPALQCVHIAAIGMFAGSIAMINLRLAGVGPAIPLIDFSRMTMRIAWIGFALVLLTGLHMASAFLNIFLVNPVMQLKLFLVLVALVNAAIIQQRTSGGTTAPWALDPPDPKKARAWVAVGISVLLTLIVLGKLLAYIGGKD